MIAADMRALALWLRPPDWQALPDAVRPRVRALAWFAIATQVLFVVGWVAGGLLEHGYSPTRDYISELGRDGAAHPWTFQVATVIWGLGFIALAPRPPLASVSIVWPGRPRRLSRASGCSSSSAMTCSSRSLTLRACAMKAGRRNRIPRPCHRNDASVRAALSRASRWRRSSCGTTASRVGIGSASGRFCSRQASGDVQSRASV